MDKGFIKKILILSCVIAVVVGGYILISDKIKVAQTVSDMALDTSNTVITGIWDEDNLSKYKYLVIPDVFVNTGDMLEFSKVTDIGECAFQGNIWIESVYIPTHIVKIQKNAFNGCTSLAKVSYAGSKEQWEKIVIESGNDCLKNLPVEYNAVAPYTSDR